MKKPVIIALIIVVVLALVFGVIFVTLNKEKTPITSSTFKTSMEAKGYTIKDSTSQFSSYDYIKQVYLAVSSDFGYQIEFYELSDASYATSFYNNNKSIFEASKGNASAETSTSLKNYSKYTLSSNGKYMVVSRIDNTVIYLNVASEYTDTVKSILDELGY